MHPQSARVNAAKQGGSYLQASGGNTMPHQTSLRTPMVRGNVDSETYRNLGAAHTDAAILRQADTNGFTTSKPKRWLTPQ